MHLKTLQQLINATLAGEMLRYDEMLPYLDNVIDDINSMLNAKYPVFSEFTPASFPGYRSEEYILEDGTVDEMAVQRVYSNYDLIPDKYIRSVIVPGVVQYWYSVDEEGSITPQAFSQKYTQGKFEMLRDFADKVPCCFQADNTGAVTDRHYYGKYTSDSEMYGVF